MKNNLKPLVLILFLIGTFSCNTDSSKKATFGKESQVFDFVKTFEGQIANKYDIVVKITSNNGLIDGTYFYKKTGGNIQLKGAIDSTKKVIINEYDNKGNQTGIFEGVFKKNRIDGRWSKPNGDNSMEFFLIESNTNYETFQKQTVEQNKVREDSKLPPSNFKGFWSNEGDISVTSRLEIELNQIDNKIDGTITYEKWNSKGELQSKSGLCSIVGTVKGGSAFIQIYSPKGKLQSEGKLLKDGDYIKFILSKEDGLFPKEELVWKF